MTDPRRRLRSLDDLLTRDLWSRIEGQAADPESAGALEHASLARRLGTIALAFAVFAAGGLFLVSRFGGGEPMAPPSDDPVVQGAAVDELKITCTDAGTIVEGDPVALQADGVHVSVRNETNEDFLYVRDPKDVERSIGMELGGSRSSSSVFAMMNVGTWVAGCFTGSFSTFDVPLSAYSPPFEVVDPHGFADDLQDAAACGEPLPDPVTTAGTEAPLSAALTGRLMVQAWNPHTGEGRLYLVDADGSSPHRIEVSGRSIDDAALSPDGSRLVLVIHSDSDGDPHTYYASKDDGELFVANADGSGSVQLTENQAEDYLPAWTPDGTISFTSNRDRAITIYTMRPDGSDVRRLVDLENADRHDWSSDGRLAFIGSDGRDRGDGCRGNNNELYVMRPGGSGPVALTEDELYEQSPAWSPDGSTIAFIASNQSDYAWEIFLANSDGTNIRRITDYAGYDHGPVWSPDGALIAFTSDRFRGPDTHGENQGGLPYVMNADGSGVQPFLDAADLGLDGDWEINVTDWRA